MDDLAALQMVAQIASNQGQVLRTEVRELHCDRCNELQAIAVAIWADPDQGRDRSTCYCPTVEAVVHGTPVPVG